MNQFRLHQRVQITDPSLNVHGRTGRVIRLRYGDSSAWVEMDEPLPDASRTFPADDPGGRARHLLICPEYCKEIMSDDSKPQEIDFADRSTSLEMIRAAGYYQRGGSGCWERKRPHGSLEQVSVPLWLRQLVQRSFAEGQKEAQRLMKAAMGIEEKS